MIIPVGGGRNLAVLVEAAVRSAILQLRGINTIQEFLIANVNSWSRRTVFNR